MKDNKGKGKMIVDDVEEEEESDEQWSDEESSDSREIVLGLPSLRVSNDEEEEKARLNEQAVTAAELVMAAVEEAVKGNKKKRTRRKTRSVKEITSSSKMPGSTNPLEGPSVAEEEARLNEQVVIGAQLLLAAASEAVMKEKSDGKKKKSKARNLSEILSDSSPRGETKKAKKKGPELTNPPEGPPVCNICGKGFSSWKAVFGHLRCHKDRNYQGFNPPPTFSTTAVPDSIPTSAAPEKFSIPGPNSAFRLVTVGGVSSVGLATGEGSSGIVHASGDGDAPRGLEIDLNVNPLEEVHESEPVAKFDLNKSPANEDEDEDE